MSNFHEVIIGKKELDAPDCARRTDSCARAAKFRKRSDKPKFNNLLKMY